MLVPKGSLDRIRRRGRPVTDLELLKEIHRRHDLDFRERVGNRSSKIMVPIDIPAITAHFGLDTDSVFGRLYYHLDLKYGEEPKEGHARKVFFTPKAGHDVNCVNFPLVEAVLAGLWQQQRRDQLALWAAMFSIGISLASLLVAVLSY